ncbi:MAG: Gfo/Idh/MocA family oxidoreductase [Kiritimatiellae bacterium]|nr:Gfo/Idh/MocA family oxidoreductase [Kiritimatiellia bacterium]
MKRRAFIKVAASALAMPIIIPSSVLGKDGATAPSNRITVGLIGVGGRMGGVWGAMKRCKGVQGVAVCDVQDNNRESYRKALGLTEKDAYLDFRELLARADVDTVAVATPDHWHVPISIAAMKAGKDVYCEKPLSNTITEGRALVNTAERYGAIFQHGTQLHSMSGVHRACELVRNGRLGKLKEIRIGSPAGHAFGWPAAEQVPAGLHYDMWLGPAPVTPYASIKIGDIPGIGLRGWYFVSDYSKAGWIAGYGVHDLDIAQWAMGLERSGPISVEGKGVYPKDGIFDTVLTFDITFEYVNGVKLSMTDTGKNRHGVTFIGEHGWIFTRGGIEAEPNSLLKEVIAPSETHLYRSPDHAQNFFDCVKTRAETITPAEVAHRATSSALLGGIACQLQSKLKWDPAREIFPDDPEANKLLVSAMRAPWGV